MLVALGEEKLGYISDEEMKIAKKLRGHIISSSYVFKKNINNHCKTVKSLQTQEKKINKIINLISKILILEKFLFCEMEDQLLTLNTLPLNFLSNDTR